MKKAPEVALDMLSLARRNGIEAGYVLFDSWPTMPGLVTKIHAMGYNVVGMVKKSSRIHFEWQGKMVSDKYIYSHSRKRRGLAHIRLWADITVVFGKDGTTTRIPARMVFVSHRANRKDWLVILCTDTSLSDEDICHLYSRRWTTLSRNPELFRKTA
ncbi:MAG: transposase [Spirochaetia bacterium]|nr:transposase [Spirochaetia bacterium]